VTRIQCLALALCLGIAPGAGAQLSDEKVLTLAGAKQVVAAAEAAAKQLGAPGGAIAVVDPGGHVLLAERLDGTFPAAAPLAQEKARSAAAFRKPTADFENAIKNGRLSLLANGELLPLQGGLPLFVGGRIVGAIGVSGAASAQQDEDIAKAAVAALGQ
jgi:glc operon protein GlcG